MSFLKVQDGTLDHLGDARTKDLDLVEICGSCGQGRRMTGGGNYLKRNIIFKIIKIII